MVSGVKKSRLTLLDRNICSSLIVLSTCSTSYFLSLEQGAQMDSAASCCSWELENNLDMHFYIISVLLTDDTSQFFFLNWLFYYRASHSSQVHICKGMRPQLSAEMMVTSCDNDIAWPWLSNRFFCVQLLDYSMRYIIHVQYWRKPWYT